MNRKKMISRIEKSDLSKNDKKILIDKLKEKEHDARSLIESFLFVCKISKEALDLFDLLS